MSDSVRDLRGGDWAWFGKAVLRMNLGWKANLAYMGIVFFLNNETHSCFPSLKKLSEQVGTSKDTIIRGIKDLEAAGLVRVDRRIDEGNNQSSVYNLLPIPVANSDKGTADSVTVVADSDKGCRSQPLPLVANSDNNKNDFKKEEIDEVPEWVPLEAWNGWLANRKKKKSPVIGRSRMIALNKLEKWYEEGYDLVQILDAATFGNWQGLYLPKGDDGQPIRPKVRKYRAGDPRNPADWLAAQVVEDDL
jgi:hypothetical protein